MLCRLCVAEVNRRVCATGALARSKSWNRPDSLDARSWWRHLGNRPLPLRGSCGNRRRCSTRPSRRIPEVASESVTQIPVLGEQGVNLVLNLFLVLGIEEFFA